MKETETHLLSHRYVWQLDILLYSRVAYERHVTRAARHALERSGKSAERIVAGAAGEQ